MPKIVDHEQRRRQLADAALRVIGRVGIEAATNQAVADEAGWSTGVLKHYFDDKDDLFRHARRALERRNLERFEAGSAGRRGYDAIVGAIDRIIGADVDEARVWIAFTAHAAADPIDYRSMQQAIDVWVGRWAELVRRGQADGSIRTDLDADAMGIELYAFISGLRASANFGRDTGRTAGTSVPILVAALRSPAADGRGRRDPAGCHTSRRDRTAP